MHSLNHQPKIHQYIHNKKPSPFYKLKPMGCETYSPTWAPQDPPLVHLQQNFSAGRGRIRLGYVQNRVRQTPLGGSISIKEAEGAGTGKYDR